MSNQKIGILASGRGSNLQSIMDKIAEGLLPLEIAVVISDKADAFALERAEKAGIPHFAVIRKECADKKKFEEKNLKLGEVTSLFREQEKEIHYWEADSSVNEGGGFYGKIRRRLKI